MPVAPAWKDLPQTVSLQAADGTVVIADMACRMWNPPTQMDENSAAFPVAMPGAVRTMWCDFDPRVEAGQMVVWTPIVDGQTGVEEKFLILGVDNTAGIGWRMQCTVQRMARSV